MFRPQGYTSTSIMSDAVTLSGFTGTMTANCNTGCTEIARNGIWSGTTTLTGFVSGDTIRIKQLSSSSSNTATTASVTVGTTPSSIWTTTTMNDFCPGVTMPGGVCPDGTIYVGVSPDENRKMYTTRCDAGMTWDGSTCTGSRVNYTWNNGSSNYVISTYQSSVTGTANTAGLASLLDAASPHAAAVYCDGLVSNGCSDWYLPATAEMSPIIASFAAIGNIESAAYWSSTECGAPYDALGAYNMNLTTGTAPTCSNTGTRKTSAYHVRCVRK